MLGIYDVWVTHVKGKAGLFRIIDAAFLYRLIVVAAAVVVTVMLMQGVVT